MATLAGVDTRIVERYLWAKTGFDSDPRRRGRALWLEYGFRTVEEQWRFWNERQDWEAALKRYGSEKAAVARGAVWAPVAAYPGTSMHGKKPAQAIDVGCDAVDNPLRSEWARKAGFTDTAVKGEPWHWQLAAVLKPLPPLPGPQPAKPVTKEEAILKAVEPIGSATHPLHEDSGWIVGARGHVYAFGEHAIQHGIWDDATRNGARRCVALVPTRTGNGYWLISNLGEVYAHGDAMWPGNYRKEWGAGVIIGAFRNSKPIVIEGVTFDVGSVTLIRDDGANLNRYALPA